MSVEATSLPDDWIEAVIEDHINFIDYRGKTPEKIESGMRLITAKNVKKGFLQLEPREYVDPAIYDDWMTRGIPNEGDVLFTTEAPLGNVAQLDTAEKVIFAQRIIIMQPDPDILDSTFLKYMLLSGFMQQRIQDKGTGATAKGIKSKLLKKIPLAFPNTVAEQKRIVSILDEAFSAIAKAKENAEKNLLSARELFESYLNRVFTQQGPGWQDKKLDELSQINSGGTPLKSTKEFWNGGDIPWYSSGELNDLYTKGSKKFITEAGLNGSNAKLFPVGSLLMGMYDTAALKMSLLDREGTFNQAVAGMRPNDDIDFRFLLFAVRQVRPEVLKLRRGVRQKNLSLAKIKAITIRLPETKAEQTKVVEHILGTEAETERLETIYIQKLANLDELKQSLLQKAFTDQLATDLAAV